MLSAGHSQSSDAARLTVNHNAQQNAERTQQQMALNIINSVNNVLNQQDQVSTSLSVCTTPVSTCEDPSMNVFLCVFFGKEHRF